MRYERKYRIEGVSLDVIKQSILIHPAGLYKIFPDRQINNIYFDTPGLTTYKENVMGIANRDKFRVRWYGWDPFVIKKPKLEIKHRRNNVGAKTIFNVDTFSFDSDFLSWVSVHPQHDPSPISVIHILLTFFIFLSSYRKAPDIPRPVVMVTDVTLVVGLHE